MPTTSPDDIFFTDLSLSHSLETESSNQATSIQEALDFRQGYNFRWPDSTTQNSQTGMRAGDTGYREDIGVTYRYDGSAWKVFGTSDWQTWSPTLTGITLGTGGTSVALYRYVGDNVEVRFAFKLGTGGTLGTDPRFTLPQLAEAVIAPYTTYNGNGSMFDNSAGQVYPTFVVSYNTSQSIVTMYALAPATSGYTNITATVPFTWAINDTIGVNFTYRPA